MIIIGLYPDDRARQLRRQMICIVIDVEEYQFQLSIDLFAGIPFRQLFCGKNAGDAFDWVNFELKEC